MTSWIIESGQQVNNYENFLQWWIGKFNLCDLASGLALNLEIHDLGLGWVPGHHRIVLCSHINLPVAVSQSADSDNSTEGTSTHRAGNNKPDLGVMEAGQKFCAWIMNAICRADEARQPSMALFLCFHSMRTSFVYTFCSPCHLHNM